MASNAISPMPRQLALALEHTESYGREDFLPGACNAEALELIDSWPDWPAGAIALVGPEGSGKTHLATIWAAVSGARAISAHALNEPSLRSALATGALVVEDASAVSDERALFHLINLAREENAFLLFTARTAPAAWPVAIPDVVSRLRAMPVVTLRAPDDAMLRAVIVKLAADRQLGFDDGVVRYLSTHIERSFAAARAAVIALDEESLRQGRPATRALAAELFRDGPEIPSDAVHFTP
jgi:chromosomal replication initiation ATPase DnaA